MNGNNSVSMRRYIICLFLPIVFFSLSGCAHIEEEHFEEQEFVTLTFKATMEDSQTKNTLGGSADDPFRSLYWLPTDEIAVYTWNSSYAKFTNLNTENSAVADFIGEGMDKDWNYAVYPYSAVVDWGLEPYYVPRINVPVKQVYAENTFATDMFPMVAKAFRGEPFQFKNLCGLLVVNLKGEENVKSIALAAYDQNGSLAKIAGTYNVNLEFEDVPVLANATDIVQGTMIEMDCGEGVQLNASEPTNFHFVLAPGEYSRIAVIVTTVDGRIMVKEGRNPLTIRRSEWISAGTLQYAESVSIDLSEIGHSNCYIVPKSGLYSFDADVTGNGEYGLVPGSTFSSRNTAISPVSAEILWEDRTGMISSVTLKDNKISFIATGQEGNALIAAKAADGEILWSWHIWSTDQPEEQVYVNDRGTFTMLDRNIGATRNDRGTGEEWRESQGMRYQWGRKDPFGQTVGSYRTDLYNRISAQLSLDESIQYPKSFVQNNTPWTAEMDYNLWSKNQKTIYDPCPVGYRVPPMDVWRGFTVDGENADRRSEMNVSGSFDYGWNFIYDGTSTAWYPTSYHISTWGDFYESEYEGHYWSVGDQDTYWKSYFRFYYSVYSDNPDFNCSIEFNQTHEVSNALAVRCMKDEGHVDTSYPTVKVMDVVDVTSESAVVVASVTDEGVSEVTERGIIWGLDDNLTVDLGNKVVADVAGGGEYRTTLAGLQNATIYYVRPYAINSRGLSYGKVSSFRTTYAGEANNLSAYGTSNCYIVDPAYCKHYINGSVKGSGYESIGSVESVEVLWETNGYGMKTDPGTVIFDVTLKDGNIYFYTNGVEGNVLVASKDAMGTILWSWHIWVTDAPAEQLYNGYYWVLDRNIGAVSAEEGTGEQWKLSCGLPFQRGRKDPFVAGTFTETYAYYSMEEAIANPTVYDSGWDYNNYTWSWSEKTIYDPCPVGYRVAVNNVWSGISRAGTDNGHGVYFYFDNDPSTRYWYPFQANHRTDYIEYRSSGRLATVDSGYYWTADNNYNSSQSYAQVRCMKDEGYVDMSYPIVGLTSIDGISSTGANLYAEITNTGIAEITSRGFIWGTSDDLSLTSGTKVDCGSGSGEFNTSLDGLSHSTRYYVRAYATNERGTSYSDVKSFYTPFEGDAVNLSRNGTANCYIVPVAYSDYIFDASVKGNSDESVGAIASAEVLWETRNTSSAIEVGDVIETVSLDGNNVRFRLPFDPVPGNALIAVKDAMGTILWSWHIWVVDFDPVATQQTYNSGAVMMDRNLGALNSEFGNYIMGDYSAYGLYYQWGRKDPMILSGQVAPTNAIGVHDNQYNGSYAFDAICNSIDYTYSHPTDFYDDINWNGDTSLWGIRKAINDPCPVGWRVPDLEVWNDWQDVSFPENTYCLYAPEDYSSPAAYYPRGGYGDSSSTWPNAFLTYGYYWSTTRDQQARMQNARYDRVKDIDVSNKASVRCMKDIGADKPGNSDDYIVDDEYEW